MEPLTHPASFYLDTPMSQGWGQFGKPLAQPTTLRAFLETCRQPDDTRLALAQAVTEAIQQHGKDHAAPRAAKGKLPWVTPAMASFDGKRGQSCHHQATGIQLADIDGLPNAESAIKRRNELVANHPAVLAGKISASGLGVHLFVAVDLPGHGHWKSNPQHHLAWQAVQLDLDLPEPADKAAKNFTRLAYWSHDPQAVQKADDFTIIPIQWPVTPFSQADWQPHAIAHLKSNLLPADGDTYNDFLASCKAIAILNGDSGLADYQQGSRRLPKTMADLQDLMTGQSEDDASKTLWAIAHRWGWQPPALPKAKAKGKQTLTASADPWAIVGGHFAKQHLQHWRFNETQGYAHWQGKTWDFIIAQQAQRMLLDTATPVIFDALASARKANLIGPEQAFDMANQWKAQGPVFASFLSGIRNAIRGQVPDPHPDFFPANNGLVNLTTGQLINHHPDYGMRSVTNGNYLPKDTDRLRLALFNRLDTALDEDERQAFCEWCGLVATGKVQHYAGSIGILAGPPGSGKGGLLQLIGHALGRLYYNGKSDLFSANRPAGHDNDLASLLMANPLIVGLDERGKGNVAMIVDQVNTWTGNNLKGPYTRKGDNTPISGIPHFAILHASTEAPRLQRGTGLERRLFCLTTQHTLSDAQKVDGPLSQELADAFVTMMCYFAQQALAQGLKGVNGTVKSQTGILADLDELAATIDFLFQDFPERWDGQPLKDLLDELKNPDNYRDQFKRIQPKALATAVKAVGWRVSKQEWRNGIRGTYMDKPNP